MTATRPVSVTTRGAAPRPRTHVRDGLSLFCVGIAGWGLAPILGEPGLALPVAAGGALSGVAVLTTGQRSARRADLVAHLGEHLAPMLGATPGRTAGLVRARSWTSGWPGKPRRVTLLHSTGRVKHTEAPLELGDPRWAAEVARQVGQRLDGHYRVATSDPVRGRLVLKLRPQPVAGDGTAPETPEVVRAKKVIGDLFGATADVGKVDVDDTGQVSRLAVGHDAGAKLVAPGYRNRIERTVSAMLPGRWRARWDMEADSVVFEVRPTLPDSIWIPPLPAPEADPLSNYDAVEIPYGVDEDGEVMAWRPAISPQLIITGGTGSGKTSTTHALLVRLSQYGWPVWVADGKAVEFLGFRDWPNVQIIGSRIEQQVAIIHRAWELMEHRYQLVVDGLARSEDFEPLVVFVDEFSDLKGNLLAWYSSIKVKGDPTKPPTLSEVASIARKGRTARIHLVVALQRPDAEILTGEARDNFTQRISVGRLSPDGAQMMWGNPVTGVTIPVGRRGRAIGVNSAGLPVEMQCYRTPDPAKVAPGTPEHQMLQEMRPAESLQDRLVIVPPEIDWSDEEPEDPTFADYAGTEWARAADRPDLDPLAHRDRSNDTDARGRALSSPMALFGLVDDPGRPAPTQPITSWRRRVPVASSTPTTGGRSPELDAGEIDDLTTGHVASHDENDGYVPATSVRATGLNVGDLVLVDADQDCWAVVEEEPVADFDDDELVVVSWRDDHDNSGQLILTADTPVQTRRPL